MHKSPALINTFQGMHCDVTHFWKSAEVFTVSKSEIHFRATAKCFRIDCLPRVTAHFRLHCASVTREVLIVT